MSELSTLKNVGKATLSDLHQLGIMTIDTLKTQDPNTLYIELCRLTNQKQDPCVWDVFAAVIHEAQTGEKTPWWEWTKVRKEKGLNLNELIPPLTDIV